MSSIIEQLELQHIQCDRIFCRFEDFVANDNWRDALVEWYNFGETINKHFSFEEDNVFTPMDNKLLHRSEDSPTEIFRVEHQHLLTLIQELEVSVLNKNKNTTLELSDTVMATILEHAQREEKKLFPMFEILSNSTTMD